jgi:hypothetical protein
VTLLLSLEDGEEEWKTGREASSTSTLLGAQRSLESGLTALLWSSALGQL